MSDIFLETGAVLILATVLGVAAKLLKQPLILAYIFAGFVIGPFEFWKLGSGQTLTFLSDLGIAFLLFLVGLELSLRQLRTVGKVAFYAGFAQIGFTLILGFLLSLVLGFNFVSALYVGLALTFSSTIICVKLLSEKNETNSLAGRVTIGILLVQDLVVVLALIFLSGFENGKQIDWLTFPVVFLKGILLFYLTLLFSKKILPTIFDHLSKSSELLFLGAVSWCFFAASVTKLLGFSLEIGAFLGGLALATSQQNWQIAARIKPLRDLFIVIFFIVLGSQTVLSELNELLIPAIIISLFILVGKPLVVMVIMKNLEFKKRTSFITGVTLAQISEFSLILTALGLKLGHIQADALGMITLVGVITIASSSYIVLNARKLYMRLNPMLNFFEKEGVNGSPIHLPPETLDNHIILVGCRRMGYSLFNNLNKYKLPFIVLDFDPEVINNLHALGVKAFFGDVSDHEVLKHLKLDKAKMVISTVDKLEDNLNLLKDARIINPKIMVILTAGDEKEALNLYSQGADFVAIPRVLSGEYLAQIVAGKIPSRLDIKKLRQKEIEDLQERLLNKSV